jgi:cation diffusion facilitator CzcD-associated flavoprotein CzcO
MVGAGLAGLAMTRALMRHARNFDCFERHDDVVFIWDQSKPGLADVRLGAFHLLAGAVGFPRLSDARGVARLSSPLSGAGLPQ